MADGDTTGVVGAVLFGIAIDAIISFAILSYELLSGSYPHRGTLGRFYQTMLLKNSISLESLVRVTIAFLDAAV